MRKWFLIPVVALALAGCGGSGGSGDRSSQLSNTIQSDAPGQLQAQYPGAVVNVSGVSCVRQGSSQSYQCNGHVSVEQYGQTQSGEVGFTGSCDNAGSCEWHSS